MSGNAGCCSDMLLQVNFLHWELLLARNIASSHLEQTGTVQQYYTVTWDWKFKTSALERLFSYWMNFTHCMPILTQNKLAKHQVWLRLLKKCSCRKDAFWNLATRVQVLSVEELRAEESSFCFVSYREKRKTNTVVHLFSSSSPVHLGYWRSHSDANWKMSKLLLHWNSPTSTAAIKEYVAKNNEWVTKTSSSPWSKRTAHKNNLLPRLYRK